MTPIRRTKTTSVTSGNVITDLAGADVDPDTPVNPGNLGIEALTVDQVDEDAANVGQPIVGDNGGTFTINADGNYTFDPGSDFQSLGTGENDTTSVAYTVTDGEFTSTATLTVTVTGVNDAPVFEGDAAASVAEGGTVTLTGDVVADDLFASDAEAEGAGELTFTVDGTPGQWRDPVGWHGARRGWHLHPGRRSGRSGHLCP